MKRFFLILLLTITTTIYADFRLKIDPIAYGSYLGEELIITTDSDFLTSEYTFKDDGTGFLKSWSEDNEETTKSFIWEEIQVNYSIWGAFAFLPSNLFQLTYSNKSMTYIDISKDYTKAIIYKGLQGDGEIYYSFYIAILNF